MSHHSIESFPLSILPTPASQFQGCEVSSDFLHLTFPDDPLPCFSDLLHATRISFVISNLSPKGLK